MPPLKTGECMISKVKNTMLRQNIFPSRSVLVGLSGGADSVALLHVMHTLSKEYNFKVFAAHINHGLRGEAALNDENFSKEICESLGIECFVKVADVRAYAKSLGMSEETAGRKVRYDFFSEITERYGIEFTATAHHRNDNAETLVMNFMRGSAIAGLCGIPYKRENYIRPLLDVTRSEIEEYCKENNLKFVTDSTNLDNVYTRNKIRNVLIPAIEKDFNPNFVTTVTTNADVMRDDEDFLRTVAENEYKRIVSEKSVEIKELTSLHRAVAKRVIRLMIDDVCGLMDVSSAVIESVYEICAKNRTGLLCDVTSGVTAKTEYGKLIIDYAQDECKDFSYTLMVGEKCYVPELGFTIEAEFVGERVNDGAEYFELPSETCEITITNRRKGDRFVPAGMNGSKSVKDYMINEKIPKAMRSRIGILRIDGEIAWIVGYRRDERFKFKKNGVKIRVIY